MLRLLIPTLLVWGAQWSPVTQQAIGVGSCTPDTLADRVAGYRVSAIGPSPFWEVHRAELLASLLTPAQQYWRDNYPTCRAQSSPHLIYTVGVPWTSAIPDSVRGICIAAIDSAGNECPCQTCLWR